MLPVRTIFALLVAVVLLALVFVQVEVTPMGPHAGAVAYTHPVLTSSYSNSGTQTGIGLDNFGFAIGTMTGAVDAKPVKYEKPAPVRKALWQAIVQPGSLNLLPISGGDSTIAPIGETCTQVGETRTTSVSAETFVVLKILEPGGSQTTYTSPATKWTITQTVVQWSCTSGLHAAIQHSSDAVSYEAGAYYFTHGFGTYLFSMEILLNNADGSTKLVGTVAVNVEVTSSGLGG